MPLTAQDEAALTRMILTLEHRGPDDTEVELRGSVGLAFTRLSLVGVDSGRQPMSNGDGSIALMANGEVYNHRDLTAALPGFRPRTRSDCEVLVPLYEEHGTGFLSDVRGILSVALHDARRHRLVLAVDPFANKPMFWSVIDGAVVFASEIKALFDHPGVPRSVDWAAALADQGLANYGTFSHDPVNTWFEGVHKVAAGSVVTIDLMTGAQRVDYYWRPSFDSGDDEPGENPSSYVQTYRELLFSSVEDSLMSEVGLGLFLSGGIDSAAIAAIASSLGRPLTTFTLATEATMLNGDVAGSIAVADHLGVDNTIATLRADDVPSPEDWTTLLWLMESPLAGPEQLYKFSLHRVAKQRHPNLKAMLLGAGADEFNGGYSMLLSGGGGWSSFLGNLGGLRNSGLGPAARQWSSGGQRGLVRADLWSGGEPPDDYADYVRWKFRDVQQYNCWMEDRCAAGNGIEARVPFLDRRLVDLATRLPRSLRPALLWDKNMARHALDGLLPEHIVSREKKPFYDGRTARFSHQTVLAMLRQQDYALVEQALESPRMSDFVDPAALRSALTPAAATSAHPELLLRLVNLGLLDRIAATPQPGFHADQVLLRAIPTPRENLVHTFPEVSLENATVLGLGDTTILAQDSVRPRTWLLIDQHRVEFTIDEDAVPDWVTLLTSLDGRASLEQVAKATGVAWGSQHEYLQLCLERGYLVVRGD